MANIRNGNTLYIDATGTALTKTNIIVSQIIFTSSSGGDNLILRDTDGTGALKISIKSNLANNTIQIDLRDTPMSFPNAIHVDTITAGATATLILKARQ